MPLLCRRYTSPASGPRTRGSSRSTRRPEVKTVVMNSEWVHPALLLRQFAQMAVWIGGDRVTAGLGAGWSAEEFTAMGMKMAPFRERMDRLEETLQIARQLFHDGVANVE